ncbi:MAG: helix-turn-helix domain-containing protein [Leucobacter sp.]
MSAEGSEGFLASTSPGASAKHAQREWNSIIRRVFGDHDTLIRSGNRVFAGRFDHASFGRIGVTEILAAEHEVVHQGAPDGSVHINYLLRGKPAEVTQGDATSALVPGGFTLTDASRDYSISFGSDFRLVVLHLPAGQMHQPLRRLAAEAASISADLPEVAAFRSIVATLLATTSAPPSARGHITRAAIDSAIAGIERTQGSATLGSLQDLREQDAPGGDDPALSASGAHFLKAQAYIEEHFRDQSLDPRRIAAGVNLSLRHLHEVFHEVNTSVMGEVMRYRLEQSRQALLTHQELPVAEIARRSGFGSASFFGRRFREAYSVSPAQYRNLHI